MLSWFSTSRESQSVDRHNLDYVLATFNKVEPWKLRDACQGILVLGQSGSGKTSGPFKYFLGSLLRMGYGGILLTTKNSDLEDLIRYARAIGRLNDIAIIGPGSSFRWNILDYELRRGAGRASDRIENGVKLLQLASELGSKHPHGASNSGNLLDDALTTVQEIQRVQGTIPSNLGQMQSQLQGLTDVLKQAAPDVAFQNATNALNAGVTPAKTIAEAMQVAAADIGCPPSSIDSISKPRVH